MDEKKTRMPRERESSHCFLIARACISIIAPDLIYGFARVLRLKRIIFFRSAGISMTQKFGIKSTRPKSARLKMNSHIDQFRNKQLQIASSIRDRLDLDFQKR